MNLETFRAKYPAFEEIEDSVVEAKIEEASLFVNYSDQTKNNLMISLLVAHDLSLEEKIKNSPSARTDKMISRTIQGGGVAYAHTQAKDQLEAYYQKSIYGEKFLALKKTFRSLGYVLT